MSVNMLGALRFSISTVSSVMAAMVVTGLQKSREVTSTTPPSPWAKATPMNTEARPMMTTLRRMTDSRCWATASPRFKIPEVRTSMSLLSVASSLASPPPPSLRTKLLPVARDVSAKLGQGTERHWPNSITLVLD